MVLSCCCLLPAALSLLDRCAADPAADRLQQTPSAHLLLLRTSMPTAPYCCCCCLLLPVLSTKGEGAGPLCRTAVLRTLLPTGCSRPLQRTSCCCGPLCLLLPTAAAYCLCCCLLISTKGEGAGPLCRTAVLQTLLPTGCSRLLQRTYCCCGPLCLLLPTAAAYCFCCCLLLPPREILYVSILAQKKRSLRLWTPRVSVA